VALGAVRPHPGCSHTLGQPSGHRLALVGYWLGLEGSHVGVLGPITKLSGLLYLFCRHVSSRKCILLFFVFVPAKHICTKTCGNVSCKALCLSFGSIFPLLYSNVSDINVR
jgi:hypothetical protein